MCPFSRKEWQWWSWSWCVCVVCACAGLRHVHFAYINRADRLWKQGHHAPAFTVHGHERVRRWRQWLKHADVSFYRGEGYESLSCGLGVWPMSGIAGRKIWIPGWQKSTNDRKKDEFMKTITVKPKFPGIFCNYFSSSCSDGIVSHWIHLLFCRLKLMG